MAAAGPSRPVEDEEAELQAALAASMAGAEGAAPAEEAQQMETEEPALAPAGPSAEEVAAEAAARLPEEPAAPDGCRIGTFIRRPLFSRVSVEKPLSNFIENSFTASHYFFPLSLFAAVRFPDGSRGQRRFPRDVPLSAVHDWCLTQSPEAAGGRPFFFSEAMPGAAPLADLGQTLEAVGVADATLVMKWSD